MPSIGMPWSASNDITAPRVMVENTPGCHCERQLRRGVEPPLEASVPRRELEHRLRPEGMERHRQISAFGEQLLQPQHVRAVRPVADQVKVHARVAERRAGALPVAVAMHVHDER